MRTTETGLKASAITRAALDRRIGSESDLPGAKELLKARTGGAWISAKRAIEPLGPIVQRNKTAGNLGRSDKIERNIVARRNLRRRLGASKRTFVLVARLPMRLVTRKRRTPFRAALASRSDFNRPFVVAARRTAMPAELSGMGHRPRTTDRVRVPMVTATAKHRMHGDAECGGRGDKLLNHTVLGKSSSSISEHRVQGSSRTASLPDPLSPDNSPARGIQLEDSGAIWRHKARRKTLIGLRTLQFCR